MGSLSHHSYCTEILAQTALLRAHLDGADLAGEVAACPGWSLDQLLRHLGGAHRWTERIVRTRATGPVADDQVSDPAWYAHQDPSALRDWLTEGAERLADTLREAGPDVPVWTVAPGGTPTFWARRMTYETVVHRADAASTVGAGFMVDQALGLDAVDEWVGFSALPQAYASADSRTALLAPGRCVRLQATDAAPGTPANWFVLLSGEPITWRRTTAADLEQGTTSPEASATVRGPLADLLLLLYGRRTPASEGITVDGDAELLIAWLEAAGDWLRR
ncbi:maleylpyruvate isomerase N-terminal domain-containing protein [Streptomyces oceani]|uniref:Mycothiol-dependent maleylpyruvate isomerase metal-binding domain-containing protein n=1 Tax=Streptomyces oceani TaxID=1075402 RepID=A0A1E7KFU1_9ACTN|nr:maleylpyruvate isomerase N-terminal domain-containing protein [Streptomyces oceani]OEV02791.1 hypothetical protein AN216_15255 [Streptomyces oceani]